MDISQVIYSLVEFFFFFFFGHAVCHVRSQISDQGLNLCHLQGKHRVLATRPPGSQSLLMDI